MVRMLGGTPSVVRPGLLSKAALAREAQVDRNQISQGSCRDLGDRFATITQQNTAPATAREAEQLIRIEHLTAQLQQLTKGRAELRADKIYDNRRQRKIWTRSFSRARDSGVGRRDAWPPSLRFSPYRESETVLASVSRGRLLQRTKITMYVPLRTFSLLKR
ncbi:MAG: hypothetical protein JWQ81_7369 [Amycolatopsis sp.]|jgi:hypothetical protein|uniref:hypothetical protein n=1 Tax=Amycolatopsis sp. TaxID=37632 RepID=UPI00262EA95E|nr:hypothetical protein [Amycolatopsis sp.]MCU1686630.1 hypothetical protein [Amycolatopsis sp.]